MRFGILGPLLVQDGEAAISVPAARQRVLLAALLLQAGQAVRAETLAEVVWDGSPPEAAADTLRTHVMRLRRVLGPRAGARLVTRSPGYLIEADEDEVDLLRFGRLCRDGAAAVRAGSWPQASLILTEALGLWRGPALADVTSQALQRDEAPRLDQQRLQAQEWRIDADLHLGKHAEVLQELHSLTAAHPLRERFHAQLMLALYRCGRQAEALAAYQRARQALVDELGAEPGSELRALHRQVLAADPLLDRPAPQPARPASAASRVPRQLPNPVAQFTGRDTELAALTRLLEQAADATPATVVISAIGGTAGVGKTALAVRCAHQVAHRFGDGQLYVNLRGYDPDQPVTAADALAGFLRALGVDGNDIPAETEERAARYRSLLAGRQVLVVLDNASDVGQVRPLLPGSPGCAALLTSRDSLAGLVARDGATRLDLDLLPHDDAVALLRRLIGARVDAEPEAAAELAAQCCRLPLALRVTAELAAARPSVSLAELSRELADQQRPLDLLDAGGDPRTAVRAVFSWSYQHLDPDAARAFRLAGLHPGNDLEPYALAALTSTTLKQARDAIEMLARAHLIQPAGPGRHGMHDLLRAYARELAARADGAQQDQHTLTGLFDYYRSAAGTAMDTLYPAEADRRPRIVPGGAVVPAMVGDAGARAWLDQERANLVAVVAHCAGHGWQRHAADLAAVLATYLRGGGHIPEALTVFSHALGAARRAGDHAAEAAALQQIGHVDWHLGRLQQAADHHRQALDLFRAAGDRAGEAYALGGMGLAEMGLGRYEQAAGHQQEAVAIYRAIGHRLGEARTLGNLGQARQWQGRYQEAARYHLQALEMCRLLGDREGESTAIARLGILDFRTGRYGPAAVRLERALAMYHEMGNKGLESEIVFRLGEVNLKLGRYEQAAGKFKQALAMFREMGDAVKEVDGLNGLGEVLVRTGEADKARAHHTAALRLASELGLPREQARAQSGLARAYQADGDSLRARHHWQQALALYAQLGGPEADEIRARLAAAGDPALADPALADPVPADPALADS
jgi:DNA-binding SARP family transcriptional activator